MKFTQKYFWLVIFIGVILAFVWPEPGFLFKDYLMYLLMLMMFLSCLNMDFRELKQVRKDWWRIVVILMIIFPVSTILTYFLCKMAGIGGMILVGMMLTAAAPCGIATTFISDLFDGEPPKALLVTILAHLISPILTPFLVYITVRQIVDVNFLSMLVLIGKLVVIPFLLAQSFRYLNLHKKLISVKNSVNTFLLVILFWGIVSPAREMIFENVKGSLLLTGIVSLILLILFLISVLFGRTRKEKITWSVTTLFKNFTLSSVISLSMFGPVALLGSIAYGIISNLSIIPLQYWSRKNKQSSGK